MMGMMFNVKDYNVGNANSGCVTVDLDTAGDVTIDMSSSAAYGLFQCPPFFIVVIAHGSRALILTNCHQSRVRGTASFGVGI